MSADLVTLTKQPVVHALNADISDGLPVMTIARDGECSTWWPSEPYLSDVTATLDRLRVRGAVTSQYSLDGLLALVRSGKAAVILVEAADDSCIGVIALAGKTREYGENIVRVEMESRAPIDPTLTEVLAESLERAAKMDSGVGICETVRISATGKFPCPRGYEFEDLGGDLRAMVRQLGAHTVN
jgi:hypothetical protein